MPPKVKDLLRRLEADGGCLEATRRSHRRLRRGTLKSNLRQEGQKDGKMRYAIVIQQGGLNYSAYVPDLPGCVSTGRTLDEVKTEMREAIAFHLEGMRKDGLPIPPPTSRATYVEIAA